jgi:hypothetical protein
MKKTTLKFSMILVLLGATGLMSFVTLSKSYFAVCGQCGWISPSSTSYSDASSMASDHYLGKSDHKTKTTSVVSLDTEISSSYAGICGQCNWQSPTVSTYSDASAMASDHYLGHEDHKNKTTSVIKKSD